MYVWYTFIYIRWSTDVFHPKYTPPKFNIESATAEKDDEFHKTLKHFFHSVPPSKDDLSGTWPLLPQFCNKVGWISDWCFRGSVVECFRLYAEVGYGHRWRKNEVMLEESDGEAYSGHNRSCTRAFFALAYRPTKRAPDAVMGKDGKSKAMGKLVGFHFHGDRGQLENLEASSICTVPSARRHMLNCVQEETNQSACISWSRC